jgi:S-formylglutathione hydrolase FrmB
MQGRLEEHEMVGTALRGNVLGDPAERPIWVYLPPGYDDDDARRYATIYLIQGFTGQVEMWGNRGPFRPTVPELIDALFSADGTPPCIVVFVDAWTSLGGSQYVDSPGTGNYHTYLCEDVVGWVDASFRTIASGEHRGITGKSSGGYGAMITPMLRPDLFSGFATHAGDALFEACYARDFPTVARALRDGYGGSYDAFWTSFRSRVAMAGPNDDDLVEVYAMAACYSADDDGTVLLPFDLATGRLIPEVWERWLRWDPVRMVADHADALRSMKAIYIDAGRSDEFFLDLGAEAFRRELEGIGITDVFFELFEGGHFAIEYRYPKAIAYLAERLSPA